ncbi:DUF808 family protein, partial [Corynebacterium bovis]|uniref:DUF808 family protein n=1 Tax=Corynebacterium bovis TaxID=36808 RepID=UPI000F643E58
MAGGLAALLDDVALIARKAAAATDDIASAAGRTSTKAAAVVVDDTAVTPRFVQGLAPARELPLIWRIAKGSLVNKLLIILPVALLLSWLAPWALTPILMLGGFYLAFEGAEKIWEFLTGHGHGDGHGTGEGPGSGGGQGEGDDAALHARGQLDAAKWSFFVTRGTSWTTYLLPGLLNTVMAAVLS